MDRKIENSRELYIKSLEGFMIEVSKRVGCLPDFTDPQYENNHILKAIDRLVLMDIKYL